MGKARINLLILDYAVIHGESGFCPDTSVVSRKFYTKGEAERYIRDLFSCWEELSKANHTRVLLLAEAVRDPQMITYRSILFDAIGATEKGAFVQIDEREDPVRRITIVSMNHDPDTDEDYRSWWDGLSDLLGYKVTSL